MPRQPVTPLSKPTLSKERLCVPVDEDLNRCRSVLGRPGSSFSDAFEKDFSLSKLKRESSSKKIFGVGSNNVMIPKASIDQLPAYLDMLYEDLPEKLNATSCIRTLMKSPDNLGIITSNDALMSALARVLTEDSKKSIELASSCLEIFCDISKTVPNLLISYRIGDASIKSIQREIERFQIWKRDIMELKNALNNGSSEQEQVTDIKRLQEELDQKQESLRILIPKQNDVVFYATKVLFRMGEQTSIEIKMVKRDIIVFLTALLEIVSYYPALKSHNKEEDTKSVFENLVIDDTSCNRAVHSVLDFLMRLCTVKSNQEKMRSANFTTILKRYFILPDVHIFKKVLSIFLNLAQDGSIREILSQDKEVLDLIVQAIQESPDSNAVTASTKFLYLMSSTENGRVHIVGHQKLLASLVKIVIESNTGPLLESSIVANVALCTDGARQLIGEAARMSKPGSGLRSLLKKAVRSMDPILWKIIRNISYSAPNDLKMVFLPTLEEIMKAFEEVRNSDKMEKENAESIICSILGLLSSLDVENFDYVKFNKSYNILETCMYLMYLNVQKTRDSIRSADTTDPLHALALSLDPSDDILLECICLVGTLFQDEAICLAASSQTIKTKDVLTSSSGRPSAASGRKTSAEPVERGLPEILDQILQLKLEDDEILLQTLYLISHWFQSDVVVGIVMKDHSRLLEAILDLMWDNNYQLRQWSGMIMDRVAEYERRNIPDSDFKWSEQSKERSYQWYHAEWCFSVQDNILELIDSRGNQYHAMHALPSQEGFIMDGEDWPAEDNNFEGEELTQFQFVE